MKTILINCNDCFALYNFRLELLKKLRDTYKLVIVAKWDNYYEKLKAEGFTVINNNLSNKNKIINELKLIWFYKKVMRKYIPDLVINYTIKPHLYSTLVSKNTKIINFVSGVGSVFLKRNLLFYFCVFLYKLIRNKVDLYIFINNDDKEFFENLKLTNNNYLVIKGEGVNLDKFYKEVDLSIYPTFIFIGRLVLEKGILDYLKAAKIIKSKYPNTKFLVVGPFYNKKTVIDRNIIYEYHNKKIINYLGYSYNINEILRDAHVVVNPSYREGLSICLIEGLASKKYLIASNVAGCKDVCIEGYNGFLFDVGNVEMLAERIEEYINYSDKRLLHEYALNSSYQYAKEFYVEKMVEIIEKVSSCY